MERYEIGIDLQNLHQKANKIPLMIWQILERLQRPTSSESIHIYVHSVLNWIFFLHTMKERNDTQNMNSDSKASITSNSFIIKSHLTAD